MGKIESRYGKNVKRAVSIAILAALPIPVPGMSVALSAPIIAFAELHRQLFHKAAAAAIARLRASEDDDEIDADKLKELAREVLEELFDGEIPDEVDLDAIDDLAKEEEANADA